MENTEYDYKIYPSLLDSFENMKTGKYGMTEQDLIDTINRKPRPIKDSMEKGKAFHLLTEDLNMLQDIIDNNPDPHYFNHGFWRFPKEVALQIASLRNGGDHEVLIEKPFDLPGFGKILIYGKVDTLKDGCVLDLKTTGYYRGISYLKSAQKEVYLYASDCREMIYIITDFKQIYYENYLPDPNLEERLAKKLYEFLNWLKRAKDAGLITDKKIFNLK